MASWYNSLTDVSWFMHYIRIDLPTIQIVLTVRQLLQLTSEILNVISTLHRVNLVVPIVSKVIGYMLDSDNCCHGLSNPSLMQILCTVIHAAVEYQRPWLWMSYRLCLSTVTGSRLIPFWTGYCSSATTPTDTYWSLCMVVCLANVATRGRFRSNQETGLKSCSLRWSAVFLFLWVGEGSDLHCLSKTPGRY